MYFLRRKHVLTKRWPLTAERRFYRSVPLPTFLLVRDVELAINDNLSECYLTTWNKSIEGEQTHYTILKGSAGNDYARTEDIVLAVLSCFLRRLVCAIDLRNWTQSLHGSHSLRRKI
jgi:hypothetical protein